MRLPGIGYVNEREVAERISGHYRLEGDDFWYREVFGGPDRPLITIGSGANPDPRSIGPLSHEYQEIRRREQISRIENFGASLKRGLLLNP